MIRGVEIPVCSYLRFVSWPFELVVENQWAHTARLFHNSGKRRDTEGTIFEWPDLLGRSPSASEVISETTDPNWIVISRWEENPGPSMRDDGLGHLRSGLYVPRVPQGRTIRVVANSREESYELGYKEIQMNRTTSPVGGDLERRTLSCRKEDGKWKFYQSNYRNPGDSPEWFENPTYYQRRGARKKFNRDILIEYCERIGLDITNPNFYQGRIAVIDLDQKPG